MVVCCARKNVACCERKTMLDLREREVHEWKSVVCVCVCVRRRVVGLKGGERSV